MYLLHVDHSGICQIIDNKEASNCIWWGKILTQYQIESEILDRNHKRFYKIKTLDSGKIITPTLQMKKAFY